MTQSYPDTTGFAYSFARGELTMNGRIWTAISGISADQPTEEGVVKGTKPYPIARTEGTMGLGEGTVTFSDDRERFDFIDALGDAWRTKIFGATWILKGTSGQEKKVELIGCRCLSEPIDHQEGADALGGEITFSFMTMKINGKTAHKIS